MTGRVKTEANPGVFQVFTDTTSPSKLVFKAGHCQIFTHTPLSNLMLNYKNKRGDTILSGFDSLGLWV